MKLFARSTMKTSLLALGVAGLFSGAAHAALPQNKMTPTVGMTRPMQPMIPGKEKSVPKLPIERRARTSATAGDMLAPVLDALSQIKLNADQQKQVDLLVGEAETRHAPHIGAKGALMAALAEQTRNGHIDGAALERPVQKIVEQWSCSRGADLAALEALHGVLDPAQRGQFATALKERFEKELEAHRSGQWLDTLKRDLGLDDKQIAAIQDVMRAQQADHDKMHAEKLDRIRAVLTAFKADTFESKNFLNPEDSAEKAKRLTDGIVKFAEHILPILTPDQRACAASLLTGNKEGAASKCPAHEEAAPTGGENVGKTHDHLFLGGMGALGGFYGGRPYGFSSLGGYPYGSLYAYRSLGMGGIGTPFGFGGGVSPYVGAFPYAGFGGMGLGGLGYGYARSYGSYYSTGYPFGWGGGAMWGW